MLFCMRASREYCVSLLLLFLAHANIVIVFYNWMCVLLVTDIVWVAILPIYKCENVYHVPARHLSHAGVNRLYIYILYIYTPCHIENIHLCLGWRQKSLTITRIYIACEFFHSTIHTIIFFSFVFFFLHSVRSSFVIALGYTLLLYVCIRIYIYGGSSARATIEKEKRQSPEL